MNVSMYDQSNSESGEMSAEINSNLNIGKILRNFCRLNDTHTIEKGTTLSHAVLIVLWNKRENGVRLIEVIRMRDKSTIIVINMLQNQ